MITICDVAPRDGLQNEATVLPVETRAELVRRLALARVPRIEATSFVSARRVPQMAGAEALVNAIERQPGTSYAGLVLNEQGYGRFRETSLDTVHAVVIATDTFGLKNANRTVADGLAGALTIVEAARADDRRVSVTISAAFGCPFEGRVDPGAVISLATQLVERGAHEIMLADTVGVAVPKHVRSLVEQTAELGVVVGLHLHNTRNTAFANAYAGLEAGATIFDASVGGIGGCPFAPRATGNICTEDLIYLFRGEGVEIAVDLDQLIGISEWLEELLGHRLDGHLYRAGTFAAVAS